VIYRELENFGFLSILTLEVFFCKINYETTRKYIIEAMKSIELIYSRGSQARHRIEGAVCEQK